MIEYGKRILESLKKDIDFEEPFFLRNLVVYPIKVPDSLEENLPIALEEGRFSIKELDPPRVDTVIFENFSNTPIFLLDGEELLGAYQNRVSNTSVWLEPGRSYRLPVSCVEEGRWRGGNSFIPGGTMLNPSLRSLLCSGVNRSLQENKGYRSDQRSLWNSIRDALSSLRISSRTSSFHDAYDNLKDEIERYASEAEGLKEKFSGFIIETPALIAIDLFGSSKILSRMLRKLIKSYLMEGLLTRGSSSVSLKRVRRFISSLTFSRVRSYPSIGCGVELRFGDGVKLLGKVLLLEDKLVHLSLFKVR
ncbi:MAG: hypothetical protein J7M13_07185 [Synergistetes bacterium]|nr:hypothetical protein [Synergistota bacterium]